MAAEPSTNDTPWLVADAEPLIRIKGVSKKFGDFTAVNNVNLDIYQGELYGFVVLEDLVFDNNTSLVVDPSEEKLKTEFDGVKQTIIPMHSVIRIDEVEKKGTSKIADLDGKIAQFPSPIYTPKSGD